MLMNRPFVIILAGTLFLTTGVLSSCSSDQVEGNSPHPPAYVEGIYNNSAITRSNSNQTLTSFSMYCFDEWN